MSDYDFFATPSADQPAPVTPPTPTQPVPPADTSRFGASSPGYGTPAPGYGVPPAQVGYGPPGVGGYPPQGPGGYPARPYGVRSGPPGMVVAVAVLVFIGAGLLVLGGLAALALSAFFGSEVDSGLAGLGAVIGVVFLAIAGVYVVIGRGLLKGAFWAMIVITVFNGLGLAGALLSLAEGDVTSGIISGAYSGVILYLLWNPRSKAWFEGRR